MVSGDARFFALSGCLGNHVRIDAFAILTGEIRLGSHVHVSPFCFLGGTGGSLSMGDHSGMSSHVSVFTKSDDYSGSEMGAPKIHGDVSVGEYAILGSGTRVMPGVRIGANATIGCNSVVAKDIQPGSVVVSRSMNLVTLATRGG